MISPSSAPPKVTTASDVFSFGAMVWALVSGKEPYAELGLTPYELEQGMKNHALPPPCLKPSKLRHQGVGSKLELLIQACMGPDAEQRPDMDTVVGYLADVYNGASIKCRKAPIA